MPVTLDRKANERSTYVLDVSFVDHDGDPVVPKAGLKWTLTDCNGLVVNSRSGVAVASPASTVKIVLSGADLAVGSPLAGTERRLLVEGTYDSDIGSDLPLTEEIVFEINDFVGVP